MSQRFRCQWCDNSMSAAQAEWDERNRDGFWCPICDGHTFLNDSRNKARCMVLLLEERSCADPAKANRTRLNKQLSPLRYPGGKSKFIDSLFPYFQPDKLTHFVEAFAGGASVGLALLDAGYVQHLTLNDLDPGIAAFWRVVTKAPDELLRRIQTATLSRATYFELQDWLKKPAGRSDDDLAWALLVCNRLAYSGVIKANPLGGKDGSSKALLARWNPVRLCKRIQHINSMGGCITVTSTDAVQLISEDVYWGTDTTVFVDPPYVQKGKMLYPHYFTEEDHARLAFELQSLFVGMPGADIIITYDNCDLIRDLYGEGVAQVVPVRRHYSI